MYRKPYRYRRARSIPRWMEYTSYAGVIIGLLLVGIVCYFEYIAQDYSVRTDSPEQVSFQDDDESGFGGKDFEEQSWYQSEDKPGEQQEDPSASLPQPDGPPDDKPDDTPVEAPTDQQPGETPADVAGLHPDLPPEDPSATPQGQDRSQDQDDQPGSLGDDELFSDGPAVIQGFVEQGDTIGGILREWLSASDVANLVASSKGVYPLGKLKLGQAYTIYFDKRRLTRLEYEITNDSKLFITSEGEKDGKTVWKARLEGIEFEVRLALIQGKVKTTLQNAMVAAGEKASLASRLSQVFAWEVNFLRDVRPGDRFRILTEKRYRHGKFEGYGRMPAVEFINRHSKYEAYAFTDAAGNATYFNAAGESLKRAFLKAPLSYSRISSHFSLARLHPILKTVRPHPGVDYAAPLGTPVKAIGQGTVTYRGYDRGAGNFITMKHKNNYESMYLHLHRFAPGLKIGDRVQQGQVIGYVGSTGYSTGPHLDFRMKKNGQFINPEKMLAERDIAVPAKRLGAFKAEREKWRKYMSKKIPLAEYDYQKAKFQ
ncbi:peptidoglycan DD-metalloendopeptidase family protein [Desulfovibrio sp. OttesenSCG-928-G15]|nr:peptidoglycan DD-metalloendopeptidase family protein [Desulfovibrio sp. OttesenSCG-928-G15]